MNLLIDVYLILLRGTLSHSGRTQISSLAAVGQFHLHKLSFAPVLAAASSRRLTSLPLQLLLAKELLRRLRLLEIALLIIIGGKAAVV